MKLLLCGDFATTTGLARVNEALADGLVVRGWDVSVLAINYHGDYHPLAQRYKLYPAIGGGDQWGVERIATIVEHVRPDACLMVHDPWIVSDWLHALQADLPIEVAVPPIVAYIPIDGTGLNPAHVTPLNELNRVVAYTRFGAEQLARAGYASPMPIVPHGIDLELFKPIEKAEARRILGMPDDAYAVLVFDANQPRKRLDIAFEAFALFAADRPQARLIYHGPRVSRSGWDVEAMAADLGIQDRLLLSSRHITEQVGLKHERLPLIYSACDLKLSTTSGEGWGLTTMEAMACGLPNLVPHFAALSEWARDAAQFVPASIAVRHCGERDKHGINTVGRVPLVEDVAAQLDRLYLHTDRRRMLSLLGRELVSDPRYRWENIAAAFDQLLREAVGTPLEEREITAAVGVEA